MSILNKILTIVFLAVAVSVSAQEVKVESFTIVPNDLTAKTNPRVDNNGKRCALVKIYVDDKITSVKGNVIGDIINEGMEKQVYMTSSSKQMVVSFEHHFPLTIVFDDYNYPELSSAMTYILKLRFDNVNATQAVIDETQNAVLPLQTSSASQMDLQEEYNDSVISLNRMKKIITAVKDLGIEDIGQFIDGISPIKKGNKYAFIDKDGNRLTPFVYDGYSYTRPWEVKKDGLWGILNADGKLIADCKYKYIDISLKTNLAALCENAKTTVIGNYVGVSSDDLVKAKFDILDLSSGTIIAKKVSYNDKNNRLYPNEDTEYPIIKDKEFLDKNGKNLFNTKFDYLYPFSENKAVVRFKNDKVWSIIDNNGNVLGKLPDGVSPYKPAGGIDRPEALFHENLLAVEKWDNSGTYVKGFVNQWGEIIIPLIYTDVSDFSEGLAVAVKKDKNGEEDWFYINNKGEKSLRFNDKIFKLLPFKNGLAISLTETNRHLIDKTGKVLLSGSDFSLRQLRDGKDCFTHNLFPIRYNENIYFYVDKNFKKVSPDLKNAFEFKDEFTKIIGSKGPGLIDCFGNIVWLND